MLSEADDVKNRINRRFDELYRRTETGHFEPYVCLICDELLKPREVKTIDSLLLEKHSSLLKPSTWNAVSISVAACYRYTGHYGNASESARFQIEQMLLSPRACYLVGFGSSSEGFSVCSSCKSALQQCQLPKNAIANNYCFGTVPSCLFDLTEVELAMLTPVKTYGYCFSYTGGLQKQLKGSLSYYKVNFESIAQTVSHFDVLGLTDNIVVLLYGQMTPEQKRKARQKNKVRTRFVLSGLEWLVSNNEEWQRRRVNLNVIRQRLRNPVLIDNSREVDSSGENGNNNMESTESFQVFFPDGTMSSLTGGQENLETFQELVQAAAQSGYDLDFRASLMTEAAPEYKDNNLVNACLLQFPYGRGGLNEQRMKGNGSFTNETNISDYVEHLSRLSQPQFHQELFTLILYNLAMKQAMVKSAGFRVRNKADAQMLAEEITEQDVTEAIGMARMNGGLNGARIGNMQGRSFLNAVDTIAGAVPHTNEAAKRARRDAEALQHHFGTPSYFLTVVPDDDNSFLLQVYSQVTVDNNIPISNLSDGELIARARQRSQLRIKYPGMCAYFFEAVLEIVIEEVIGWDLKVKGPRQDIVGLFGVPEAFTASMEEQGRKTLHSHMQIWIRGFEKLRNDLHSEDRNIRRAAERSLCKDMDRVGGCSLLFFNPDASNDVVCKAFPHMCSVESEIRRRPVVVDDQQLRNLRSQDGQIVSGGKLACCPDCSMAWTSEELVESYLVNKVKVASFAKFPDNETRRLKAMAVEYQKGGGNSSLSSCIIDAAYNHHSHTRSSCFGKAIKMQQSDNVGTKRKQKPGKNYECRYRYPQRKKRQTIVQNASQETVKWFSWHGSWEKRFIKEVCVSRQPYDAFQNVSCQAISHSKLTCNTNISMIMPGPIGQYAFKYTLKGTQEDDTEEYGRVAQATQRMLSKLRLHESNRSEAIRRLLGASFAHQKTNVVGGAMGSYLTRNKSRFIFSHKSVWIPLRDIRSLLKGEQASASIMHHGRTPFFQCVALHYLCRPLELECLCAFDFFSLFEVVRITCNTEETAVLQFSNCAFQHASYRATNNRFLQGVKQRNEIALIKVFQYDFPDTAEFDGSLLDAHCRITDCTERYCEQVLLLFHPHRQLVDLTGVRGSYTLQFRESVANGIIGAKAQSFLQNLQDAKSNSFRVTRLEDDLQRHTTPFKMNDNGCDMDGHDEIEEDGTTVEGQNLDELLRLLNMEREETPVVPERGAKTLPTSLSVGIIRQKGCLRCGYECLANMSHLQSNRSPIVETQLEGTPEDQHIVGSGSAESGQSHLSPSQRDIVTLLLQRTTRRSRTFEEISKNNEPVNVLEANGSVRSIIDWAKKAGLDRGQRRAFEIMTATFILTFFLEAPAQTEPRGQALRHSFISEKKRLEHLSDVRKRGSDQLICLLHGPGGSGKTAVIDLLMEYAREYCSYLENFVFTSRTIVVTAMTGVAATILLGQTTHSAVYLNQKRPIEAEQVELWAPTKLLIIDEISFASKDDFIEMHKKLRQLKQCLHLPYGGLSIIFAGDMRQLEPIGMGKNGQAKKPIYEEACPEFQDWINCFVELHGMHRFKDDPEWGYLLLRFRDGQVTIEDIDTINECVVKPDTELPEDLKYATYFNRDRDSINTALFQERCKIIFEMNNNTADSIMIFSDNIQAQNSSKTYKPFENYMKLWEGCGEDDVKLPRGAGRMDPVLKLYRDCRVMLPANNDVSNGQANGTQATFQKVVLKSGVQTQFVLLDGVIPVAAVLASQVSHVVLRHTNDRIRPCCFSLKPKQHSFKARMLKPRVLQIKGGERELLQMKAYQLPLLINNATTGHKLQGSGVDSLFVHNWSYVQNWVYVMLSRVRTRAGLFCRKPLSKDLSKYVVPEALQRMLHQFRSKSPTCWNDEEYDDLFDLH